MEAHLREQAHQLLDLLPAESTFEDLIHELYELRSIERARADVDAGRLTPHDEAKRIVLQGFRNQ